MEEKKDRRGGARVGSGRKPRNESTLLYKSVSINLREDWLAQIEAVKGDITRHKWIIKTIREKLAQGESQQDKVLKTIFRRSDGTFGIRRGLAHEEENAPETP